jgi:hypothetical protein
MGRKRRVIILEKEGAGVVKYDAEDGQNKVQSAIGYCHNISSPFPASAAGILLTSDPTN